MKSHECILDSVSSVFSFYVFIINILWNCVVNVEQCNDIIRNNSTNEFRKTSININFTRNWNTLSCKAAVYIARNKAELCLECRPAFSGNCNDNNEEGGRSSPRSNRLRRFPLPFLLRLRPKTRMVNCCRNLLLSN